MQTASKRIIVWFRNDLRVRDNAALNYAQMVAKHNPGVEVLPVYTFDPRFTTQKSAEYGS